MKVPPRKSFYDPDCRFCEYYRAAGYAFCGNCGKPLKPPDELYLPGRDVENYVSYERIQEEHYARDNTAADYNAEEQNMNYDISEEPRDELMIARSALHEEYRIRNESTVEYDEGEEEVLIRGDFARSDEEESEPNEFYSSEMQFEVPKFIEDISEDDSETEETDAETGEYDGELAFSDEETADVNLETIPLEEISLSEENPIEDEMDLDEFESESSDEFTPDTEENKEIIDLISEYMPIGGPDDPDDIAGKPPRMDEQEIFLKGFSAEREQGADYLIFEGDFPQIKEFEPKIKELNWEPFMKESLENFLGSGNPFLKIK